MAVAPLVIGIAAALRQPPPRSECAEAAGALVALAMVTAVIVSLPRHAWEILLPVAWSLPILLWLAARSRPVFAAAGAFLVSNTIVWTTTFGIGHFGDASFPLDDRILGAQTAVLFVAVSAHVLAALFAERRESEARLIRANVMLEREQDNKLMNVEAVTAALAHEVKQPLTAIVLNGSVALLYLDRTPPDLDEVRRALSQVIRDGHRAGDVFESIRALFRKGDQGRHQTFQQMRTYYVLERLLYCLSGCSQVLAAITSSAR
jgi:signal transduction histidine kinase